MNNRTRIYRSQLVLSLVLFASLRTALADLPAKPSSTPGQQTSQNREPYQPGLVAEIYKLPVRPRSLRNPVPGLATTEVRVVPAPTITSAADIAGLNGNVQVDFSGEIHLPSTGNYTFSAAADDAMDLSIGDQLVLTNAWINGNNAPTAVTKKFTAGWHPIRVRFYQGDGGFNLAVRWQPPGAPALREIPSEMLRVSSERIAAAQNKRTVDEQAESADPSRAHRFVFRTQGFLEIPEREGDLLSEVLEGPTLYSQGARKDFGALAKATNFRTLPYGHQVVVLSGFLRGWHDGQTLRESVTTRALYTLSQPRAVEYEGWRGAKRQGFEHIVTIGDQKFTIHTPAADSPERENVAQALAGLPGALRNLLKRVIVEPYGTANEFNGGGDEIWVRRSEATPRSMLDNTLAHEIGHLLMNRTDCYVAWQAAIAKDVLSISHYARLNPSEDFADFMRLFLSTNADSAQMASLRQIFPARTQVLDAALKEVNFNWKLG